MLYFVGCYASFDKRNQQVAKSFIAICRAAGVRVGILGKEEKCCGEPPRKLGNEYLYQMLAKANIERIQHYGVKRIVTTCPHCYNTLCAITNWGWTCRWNTTAPTSAACSRTSA